VKGLDNKTTELVNEESGVKVCFTDSKCGVGRMKEKGGVDYSNSSMARAFSRKPTLTSSVTRSNLFTGKVFLKLLRSGAMKLPANSEVNQIFANLTQPPPPSIGTIPSFVTGRHLIPHCVSFLPSIEPGMPINVTVLLRS
jgi:hypothetical protein